MLLRKQGRIESEPLKLSEVPDPEPGPGEVRLKVSACAICRTDLHVIEGDLTPIKLPIIPGHQIVGYVDKLGPGSKRFKMGQRIGVAWLRQTDGSCIYCLRGSENLCPNSQYTGYTEHGGFAELAVVPEDFAYELSNSMSDAEVAPLLCAGLIGYRALQRAAVPEGGRLLLIGFGSSAHIVLQLALQRGYRVFVVSRAEKHLGLAQSMGAEWAGLNIEDLPEKMDSSILFAPAGEIVPAALKALDRGGILAIAGIHLSDIPSLNYQDHLFQEREIRSVTANTRQDGIDMFIEASLAHITPHIECYRLEEANQALLRLKSDETRGTAVLLVGGHRTDGEGRLPADTHLLA